MPASKVQDKHGEEIKEGDYVFTRIRGGSHQGKVEKIVTDEATAEQEDVKNPPKTAASLLRYITSGNPGEDQSVEDAWDKVQVAIGGKTNLLDIDVSLTVSGAIPGDILNLLNGYLDLELNSMDNKDPAVTGADIYPFRTEEDVVWANIPGTSLADVQVTSEYIGNLNTQWLFKYWPTTREVVDNFIAISPDFRGTVIADSVCPLLTGIFCTPALFQQRYKTESIDVLRADGSDVDGSDSAYVPTTTLYSIFDEIVQPQSGTNTSAILNDSRKVGVSNNHAQTVCAGQPAGGVYTHEGMLYRPLTWALAADALRHGGPGDISRIDTEKVCADVIAPQLAADDLLGS
ncbi:putative lipase [Aspergillus undulatus]|uniref:putative lipase n=1 Tax=Aspergillus undulatus TaxID=1810928 RepID=UPI003CCCBF8A